MLSEEVIVVSMATVPDVKSVPETVVDVVPDAEEPLVPEVVVE